MILKTIIILTLFLGKTQIAENHSSVHADISQIICPQPLCKQL